MKRFKPHQRICIHLFESVGHPFDISNWELIKSIRSEASFLKLIPVQIVADPFLFVHHDELFLFYEKQILGNNGTIEMIKTKDLINWTEPITVLKRGTHLSYPFVFEDAGNIFMILETYQEKNVQLCKANKDLTEWRFEKELLNGEKYVDSSIIRLNQVYYLFTTVLNENNEQELQLFFSKDLYGEFEKHPKSPIAKGNLAGRCGGAIFEYENTIYRPTQICEKYYGESLSLYSINVLTTSDYQEEIKIDRLLCEKFVHGGHHFHFTKFNNKLIIATDANSFTFNIWEFYKNRMRKINNIITSN